MGQVPRERQEYGLCAPRARPQWGSCDAINRSRLTSRANSRSIELCPHSVLAIRCPAEASADPAGSSASLDHAIDHPPGPLLARECSESDDGNAANESAWLEKSVGPDFLERQHLRVSS
jgi:hypothetical protein